MKAITLQKFGGNFFKAGEVYINLSKSSVMNFWCYYFSFLILLNVSTWDFPGFWEKSNKIIFENVIKIFQISLKKENILYVPRLEFPSPIQAIGSTNEKINFYAS